MLGMNPGPWGMAQTGVPFGEVQAAKDWLGISAAIGKPKLEHPKRRIDGLLCPRSEVSGRRLWGLFAKKFKSPQSFFLNHYVANYCPLVFMEESARNLTPDKLPASIRTPLLHVCDAHLASVLELLNPEWVIGVGGFAEQCATRVLARLENLRNTRVGKILHPSPASPAANKDWAGTVTRQLNDLGIW